MSRVILRRLLGGFAFVALAAMIAGGYAYYAYRTSTPPVYAAADAPAAGPLHIPGAPRLALVLSSGGGRGYAHVGVLKVLDAAGIRPDLVVGTSVGALIGALYASGLAPGEIERRALAFDYFSIRDFTLSRYGELTGEALQRFVNDAVGARPIQALEIAFAVVAADLSTGAMAVFTRGNTGAAVRASAATPGTVVPLRIGAALYSDGDIVSPLPVRAARRLGALRVIAVDVSADPAVAPLDEIPVTWAADAVTRRALIESEAPEADVIIRPKLPYYVPHTRAYKEMAIARGEEAARTALPRLLALWAASRRGAPAIAGSPDRQPHVRRP